MESGKIIVVANQKGGVAKTSTVRNLSYALAEMGKKVLVVDFDPQYNLTTSFGVLPTQAPYNTGTLITNLLLDESLPDTNECIQKIGSVDLIPSSRSLTVAEANLLMTPDSNDYLAALLNPLRLSYDYITEQPTRHFTDAEVRRNYEYILTSTNLYPPELHSAVRSVLSEPPLNPDWSDKGRQIAALFTPYGDREYQGDLLYRTRLHGEDGISFFFDEGYGRSVPVGCITDTWESPCHWRRGH